MYKLLSVICLCLLSACSAPPTPLPVDLIFTPPPTAEAGALNPEQAALNLSLQIALDANLISAIPAADLDQLSAAGDIQQLNAAIAPNIADLAITFGNLPNATQSPQTYHVSAMINPRIPPFDNAEVKSIFIDSLHPALIAPHLNIDGIIIDATDPPTLIALRNRYANVGFPDGFDIRITSATAAGLPAIQSLLASLTIQAHTTTQANPADNDETHLVIFAWTTPEQRASWEDQAGAENIIDLFALPISYLTSADVEVLSYTPFGFPIPTKRPTT